MSSPAKTPDPPYYAAIFTSIRSDVEEGYAAAAEKMVELATRQPGFLGIESVRGADGFGITVSYWQSEEAIANWRSNAEHRAVQKKGLEQWYAEGFVRVAKVERARRFTRSAEAPNRR